MANNSDTEDLVLSISADTRQIMNAMKRLERAVGDASSGMEKSFLSVGKGIDAAVDTSIQKRIAEITGIAAKAQKEWGGALANQGAEMDKLRAKYSPMFAAQEIYLGNLKEIKIAHAIGALSAAEMSAAILREKASFAANVVAIKGMSGALDGASASARLTVGQLLNLSRQGNDVITMWMLGAPAMQIFATQAGQVYDALESGPNGVRGSLRAIGESALDLATRFPMATAAVVAAAAAFAAYKALGGSDIRDLDDILKQHEENIKRLGDAYDVVSGKQHQYAEATANTINAQNESALKDTRNLLLAQVKDLMDEFYRTIGGGGGNQAPLQTVLQTQFMPFADAIEGLAERARNGAPDIKLFKDEVTDIAKADPKNLDGLRAAMVAMAEEAGRTEAALPGLGRQVDEMVDVVDRFQQQLDQVSSAPVRQELQKIFDEAREGTPTIDGIREAIAKVEQANPNFASIIQAIRDIALEAYGANEAIANLYASRGGPLTRGKYGRNPQLPETAPTPERRVDPYFDDAPRRSGGSRTRVPKRTADDKFFEDLEAIRQRTQALMEEQAMIGMSFEAQAKRKVAFELETQALKDVREEARRKGEADWQNAQLTPEQVRAIEEVAAAYAKQAEALRKAQEAQQLQRDVLEGAFNDLRSALDDGKLDWNDFANIALNALDRVIDKIQGDLIDAILEMNSAGGGGGNIFSQLIGLLFGGSSSTPAVPAAAAASAADLVPRMPDIAKPSAQSSLAVTFAPSVVMHNPQPGVGAEVKSMLQQFESEFTPRVVKSLREIKVNGLR